MPHRRYHPRVPPTAMDPATAVESSYGWASQCVTDAVVYLVAGWDEDVTDVLSREEEP